MIIFIIIVMRLFASKKTSAAALVACIWAAASVSMQAADAAQVNVYTERQPAFLKGIFAAFTAKSGIEVEVLYVDKGLVERLASEGSASPADVAIFTDFGRLDDMAQRGLARTIGSPAVEAAVPAWLRDPLDRWTALTRRARLIYVRNDEPDPPTLYDDLAAPGLVKAVCLRSGTHPYNIALIADYIGRHGEDQALAWLTGIAANLAREPQGNDRAQIKGVAAGECRYGIANSYYYFKMKNSADALEREAAGKVQWSVPVFAGGGTHVNISGIAMVRHAANIDEARELIEFMVGREAQAQYAAENFEIPVREDVAMPPELAEASARIASDTQDLAAIGRLRIRASQLAVEAGLAK